MSRMPMTKQLVTGANISSLTVLALAKLASSPWILAITRSWVAAMPPKASARASSDSWLTK